MLPLTWPTNAPNCSAAFAAFAKQNGGSNGKLKILEKKATAFVVVVAVRGDSSQKPSLKSRQLSSPIENISV